METPRQKRNRLLAGKMIRNFEKRNMEAWYCETAGEAVNKVLELIPQGSSVSWGGSATIRDMGLPAAIHQKNYEIFDRDLTTEPDALYAGMRKVFSMDYYITSANAVSEDGLIVNVDRTGNRIAAITFGPKHVIFIVGMNKIARDEDAATKRARCTAAPINAIRLGVDTPCKIDGICHDCNSPECLCSCIHILRNSFPVKKYKIILVGEDFGY